MSNYRIGWLTCCNRSRTFQLYSGEEIAIKVEGKDTFLTEDAIMLLQEAVKTNIRRKCLLADLWSRSKRSVIRDRTLVLVIRPLCRIEIILKKTITGVSPGADDFERFYWASLYAQQRSAFMVKQFQVMSPHTGVANLRQYLWWFRSLFRPDIHDHSSQWCRCRRGRVGWINLASG